MALTDNGPYSERGEHNQVSINDLSFNEFLMILNGLEHLSHKIGTKKLNKAQQENLKLYRRLLNKIKTINQ